MGGDVMAAGGAGNVDRLSSAFTKHAGYDVKSLFLFLKNMAATGSNLKNKLAVDPALSAIMDKVEQGEQKKLLPHEVQLVWKGIFSIFKGAVPDMKQAMITAGKAVGVVFDPVRPDTGLKVLPDKRDDIVFEHAPYSPNSLGDTYAFKTAPYIPGESDDGVRTLPLYLDDRSVPGRLTPPPGEK